MADEHGTDMGIAHKLARVARVHFRRQRKGDDRACAAKSPSTVSFVAQIGESLRKAIQEEAANKRFLRPSARDCH